MSYGEFIRRSVSLISIIIVTFFLIVAIIELSSILIIVFTCWVLAVGLNQAILRFRRWGMSRGAAVLITVLSVIAVIVLTLFVIIPPFVEQGNDLLTNLPTAVEDIVQRYEDFRQNNPTLAEVLPEFTVADYQALFETTFDEVVGGEDGGNSAVANDLRQAALDLDVGQLVQSALPLLGGISSLVGSVLANLTLILLITSYLLFDPLVYYRPIIAVVPRDQEKRVVEIISKIRRAVVSWMGALFISIAFTSTMVALAMGFLLQLPNAIALGVIAGLGTFIPNVGYYIGLVPIIIFTLAADPVKVIPAALVYWAINEFEGKVISPNIIRNQLNIPAGVVIPFQLIAASVFGFFGILLAVPMLAIFVILWQELYVYDTLDKRGHSPKLIETFKGELVLLDDDEEDPELERQAVIIDKPLASGGGRYPH
jgi:predicted PurR-regulated permease PerM